MKKIIAMIMLLGMQSAFGMDVPRVSPVYQAAQLIQAAQNGDLAQVQHLIAQGADVNAMDKSGRTALIIASEKGNVAMVKVLLAVKNIDVNAIIKISRTSALMVACTYGHSNVVKALLAVNGIRVNAANPLGVTALMLAALNNRQDIVCPLLEAGANGNATDARGNTALIFAFNQGHSDIILELITCIPIAEQKQIREKVLSLLSALKRSQNPQLYQDMRRLITQTTINGWAHEQMPRIVARISLWDAQRALESARTKYQHAVAADDPEGMARFQRIIDILDPHSPAWQSMVGKRVDQQIKRIIAAVGE